MRFVIGERVITRNDPIFHTGRTGTVVALERLGVIPSHSITCEYGTVSIVSDAGDSTATVYTVQLDGENQTVPITRMYLELENPKSHEAVIEGHQVRVNQEDNGYYWIIALDGEVKGPKATTETEAKEWAHALTHFLLTGNNDTCACKEPIKWTEVTQPKEERVKRLIDL
jgi:hypothetical protein